MLKQLPHDPAPSCLRPTLRPSWRHASLPRLRPLPQRRGRQDAPELGLTLETGRSSGYRREAFPPLALPFGGFVARAGLVCCPPL